MKTLYALFVGINAYYESPLHGCLNDLLDFKAYLERHCEDVGIHFKDRTLTDQEATRDNIIAAFGHYQEAKKDDYRLFFYAGHGSRCPAPKELEHLQPDGMLESIVCYFGENKERKDLLDKELSYLIWEVSKDKGLPFITVMDCCHSGSFRDFDETTATERALRDMDEGLAIEQFHGIKHYAVDDHGRISPPKARRIHLAAARDTEKAKELSINGRSGGVFTSALIQALNLAEGIIPYDELMIWVNRSIRNSVKKQSAQIEATFVTDQRFFFLSDKKATNQAHAMVSYNKRQGWVVNAGALHDISVGKDLSKPTFVLVKEDHVIEVTEVFSHYSKVKSMDGYDLNRSYPALLKSRGENRFKIAFANDCDKKGLRNIKRELEKQDISLLHIKDDPNDADFLVHAKKNTLFLSPKLTATPIIPPLDGYSKDSVIRFLHETDKILRWYRLLDLHNRSTDIQDSELNIELFRTLSPGNYDNDVELEAMDWRNPGTFSYQSRHGNWYKPAFQLRITNTGRRTLWISLLYLGNDFSVTNQLIPKEALEAGMGPLYAKDVHEGQSFLTHPIAIQDFYYAQGIDTITEHLKLMICSEEFDTTGYNQDKIDLGDRSSRSQEQVLTFGWNKPPNRLDWKTITIPIDIYRPLEVT